MPTLLVALDEGPDIVLDRAMLIVGRHPQCDARLDSIRVSRRHCCMMHDKDSGEVIVRDLGSTNGIRINGQRVEMGKLRHGDELSIAHIRYRMEAGPPEDVTLAETMPAEQRDAAALGRHGSSLVPAAPLAMPAPPIPPASGPRSDNPLAAAVREMLPAAMADRCRIQVIVQMPEDEESPSIAGEAEAETPESDEPCPPDSSHSTPV